MIPKNFTEMNIMMTAVRAGQVFQRKVILGRLQLSGRGNCFLMQFAICLVKSSLPVDLLKYVTLSAWGGIIYLAAMIIVKIVGNSVVTLTILQVSSVPLIPLKVAGVKVIWV
jgi:hypothetical protein